jgi:hypothetical protein
VERSTLFVESDETHKSRVVGFFIYKIMDLGVVWRLQDLMSSPLANITRNANQAQRAVDNASSQISQGMQRAIDTANSLQEAVQIEVPPVVVDVTQAQRELREYLQYRSK